LKDPPRAKPHPQKDQGGRKLGRKGMKSLDPRSRYADK
jgi:hypothetical protein